MKALTVMLIGLGTMGCQTAPERAPARTLDLLYYIESYSQCRQAFVERANDIATRYQGVETKRLLVPSKMDNDLSIDVLYVPAQKSSQRLLIMTSGLHGMEGFVGSAVQRMFLAEISGKLDLSHLGLLIIHSVNPYGFKHQRRVSENNVDLNRNFSVTPDLFATKNEGYGEASPLLNPEEKVDLGKPGNVFFVGKAVMNIAMHGMAPLRQAVLSGQYHKESGLYFGGKRSEPHRALLEPLLLEKMEGYSSVFAIDLHSGYGRRGHVHLFPNPVENPKTKRNMERIFKGYTIDWGDSDGFYTISGDLVGYIGDLAGPQRDYIPMVFEAGTLDSQTTSGSIDSIHRMILENQGFHHGYASQQDRSEVARRMREMYLPSSPYWRTSIMQQNRQLLAIALERYNGSK